MRKLSTKKVRKKRIIYKKRKCSYIMPNGKGCFRNAVGKTDLCEKHGGRRFVEESLVAITDASPKSIMNSKFEPAVHPIMYLQLAQEGLSIHEIAAEMKVASGTIKSWAETYEEFAYAYELGADMHKAYYITKGKDNMSNPMFRTSLFKFLAMNTVGFSDKSESNTINLNANVGVLLAPAPMDVDSWEQKNIDDDEAIQEAEFTEVSDEKNS